MNNKFVKDSLLHDEKILATAKFHPIKNWIVPLFVFAILITINILLVTTNPLSSNIYYHESKDCAKILECEGSWKSNLGEVHEEWYWRRDVDGGIRCHKSSYRIESLDRYGMNKVKNDLGNENLGEISENEFRTLIKNSNISGSIIEEDYYCGYEFSLYMHLLSWVIIIVLIYFVYRLCRWVNSKDEFVITNKRVVAKVGVIRRVAFELHNEQMESIEIRQGIIGRILNFGTLMPCGIGASKVRIPFVVNPFEFRQHFYDLKKPQNN